MSKLKATQYTRGKSRTRVAVPYDVQIFKRANDEFEEGLGSPNTDLPSVGKYVNSREKDDVVPKKNSDKEKEEQQTFTMENHENDFFRAVRVLWREGKMCDVQLSVEKTVFRAHRIALAACSEHFRDLFANREKSSVASDTSRIPLLGIKTEIVRKIVDAVYTARISLNSSSVGDVLSAAAYLRMPSIVQACQVYLSRKLSLDNCVRTLQIAHLYNLEKLKERSYEIACSNFKVVSKQKEFAKLRYYELLSMLPRQDLVVDSEIQVFNAIIRWTEAERSTRLPYVGRLMRYVRFPLMTESQLVDHVEGASYVAEIPEVSELVREAVRYHLLPYRRSILQNSRTIPRTAFQIKAVVSSGGLPGKEYGSSTGLIYYFDPSTNNWDTLAEMPEPRHHHAAVVLGGFLYIAGGDRGQGLMDSSNKMWRYDPWSEEWLQVTSMLKPRQSFQLGVLDSRIYAVGGRMDKNNTLSDVERYNPSTNTWSVMEQISSPRRYVALATLSGRLYAVGGSGSDLISRRVERFNPVSSQWERRHPLCKPRFSAFLHASKNRLWLVGGATVHEKDPAKGVVATSEIEVYSPALDQWTIVDGSGTRLFKEIPISGDEGRGEDDIENYLQTCRTEAGSCMLNDDIYLVAGYSWDQKDRLSDVERINLTNLTPQFPKYSTVDICQHGLKTLADTSTKKTEDENSPALKPTNYPIRCTGVACAVLTLHKKPNFKAKESELVPKTLQILGPTKTDAGSSVQPPPRCVPRLAFGEIPKTANGRFHYGSEEFNARASPTPRDNSIEKGLEFLRNMGFPSNEIRHLSEKRKVHRNSTSPRLREADASVGSSSIGQIQFDLEDVTLAEGLSPEPGAVQDEVDIALDKVISLTFENWDDQSGRNSTPGTEPEDSRAVSNISDNDDQPRVFMTE